MRTDDRAFVLDVDFKSETVQENLGLCFKSETKEKNPFPLGLSNSSPFII